MSTNNRSSSRKKRVPSWFSDHVMENLSQKKNDDVEQDVTKEIRVKKVGLIDGIGKNDLETDKGVFGNVDNSQNKRGNSYANKDVSVDPLTESEFDVTSNKRDKNCMDSNENDESAKYSENVVKPTENKKMNETYLSKVKDEIPKKLCYKPTVVNDNGTKVIVFDEMLEKKGRERWTLTACSYFVGYRIPPNELRYNIRRMWGIDGISALAISLVNPLIMDTMTASMCYSGLGRLDFARVLVEMDAGKEFKKEIEVQYRDGENKIKGIKKVSVTYDWKPDACTHCKVFRHDYQGYQNHDPDRWIYPTIPHTKNDQDRNKITTQVGSFQDCRIVGSLNGLILEFW
ncbi:hypothetical protein Tco_0885364 [Tanacetum coccineum]